MNRRLLEGLVERFAADDSERLRSIAESPSDGEWSEEAREAASRVLAKRPPEEVPRAIASSGPGLELYQKLIDGFVAAAKSRAAKKILDGTQDSEGSLGSEDSEEARFLTELSPSQKKILAGMLTFEGNAAVGAALQLIDDMREYEKVRILLDEEEMARDPFGLIMLEDFWFRCEGKPWPKDVGCEWPENA